MRSTGRKGSAKVARRRRELFEYWWSLLRKQPSQTARVEAGDFVDWCLDRNHRKACSPVM
ncbi:hypothetical protein [Brevibacterium sp. S111]|uniref:hypothetical protein n=1 Tax=Brevibacterium sp. S111 TaxID=2483795 RepID=UPI00108115FC|nr:hypothetical protein [Brevibacterium sp. S111]